jgi:hypothetical protein
MNPGTPVNKVDVVVSGVAGALSGGAGGAAVTAVARDGAVTVGRAVAAQAGANTAIGGAAASAQGAIEGTPVSGSQIAAAAVSNAVGGLAGGAAGMAAGDFAAASAKETLQRMAGSASPGAPNIAAATASTGIAIPRQSATQAVTSQAGQASGQAAATEKEHEKGEHQTLAGLHGRQHDLLQNVRSPALVRSTDRRSYGLISLCPKSSCADRATNSLLDRQQESQHAPWAEIVRQTRRPTGSLRSLRSAAL